MALERKELVAVWPLYQEIIDHYNKTIIWQQHAKEVMAKVLSDAYQDFGKKRGPLWVVFFKWPTGVGKSEIVKQTAKLLFGDSHDIVRIDCDQLKQSHEDAVLFGAPPGYIGYNAPAKFSWVNLYASYKLGEKLNTLHKIAKKRKNMAIIVFEEIEKAHPQIIQGLLKMMEEDEVSLKNGETVFLWHSLIVFTSNVWEKASQDAPKSLWFWKSTNEEDMKKKLDTKKQYFEKQFSPEFIWRLDHIVEFEPLKTDATQELINKLKEDLICEVLEVTSSKTTLQIDPNINTFISTKADISKGMRNIEKVWEREIRTNIWTILKINHLDQVDDHHILEITVEDEKVKFFLSPNLEEWLVIVNHDKTLITLHDYKKNTNIVPHDDEKESKKQNMYQILDILDGINRHNTKKKSDNDNHDKEK